MAMRSRCQSANEMQYNCHGVHTPRPLHLSGDTVLDMLQKEGLNCRQSIWCHQNKFESYHDQLQFSVMLVINTRCCIVVATCVKTYGRTSFHRTVWDLSHLILEHGVLCSI